MLMKFIIPHCLISMCNERIDNLERSKLNIIRSIIHHTANANLWRSRRENGDIYFMHVETRHIPRYSFIYFAVTRNTAVSSNKIKNFVLIRANLNRH